MIYLIYIIKSNLCWELTVTRPEPVPKEANKKKANKCVVKPPLLPPTEEEIQICSVEEEILNQGMKAVQLYQYDLIVMYIFINTYYSHAKFTHSQWRYFRRL